MIKFKRGCMAVEITVKDVEYLAEAAKFEFTEDEKQKFAQALSDVINAVDVLAQTDTQGVQPTIYVISVKNVFREDEVLPSMDRDILLKNAADVQDGCYRVPKVVE
nr:Asp-tRNA(Asn)/Glu-tRNA(Gln) amidotransferase GatCAB subunit C [Clostridia bacterium]